MIAVVDCNNFFVSCERAANPALEGKAVLVLSNNDGCVVARSNEVKAIGIKMGVPFFKVKALCAREGVVVRSGNMELYSATSEKVMNIIDGYAPLMEVYSIDEAFVDWTVCEGVVDLEAQATQLRAAVLEQTRVPVSVGIAPTKTLAKIANEWAKTRTSVGVYDITQGKRLEEVLKELPVGEVWGIGPACAARLNKAGIFSAWQLREAPASIVGKLTSIVGQRIQLELQGQRCMELHAGVQASKSIQCTRSFGAKLDNFDDMREAVASFVARAAEKLRSEGEVAGRISVFVRTDRFKPNEPQYAGFDERKLGVPLDSTPELTKVALGLLEKIYKTGYRYKKAGVTLTDLGARGAVNGELFEPVGNARKEKLMAVYDKLVAECGRGKVFWGAMGVDDAWKGKHEFGSVPVMEAKGKTNKTPKIRFIDGA